MCHIFIYFFYKFWKHVCGGSVINGGTPSSLRGVYQNLCLEELAGEGSGINGATPHNFIMTSVIMVNNVTPAVTSVTFVTTNTIVHKLQ